jgi:hypothetical protein
MAIDTETPQSAGWWLKVLSTELHNRRAGRVGTKRYHRNGVQPSRIQPGLQLLADYLEGDPPLREDIHSAWAAPFRQFLRVGRMNVAPKLVSSTTNRMGIRDFRTAAADDELGDIKARELMKRNDLKLKAREVHDDMLGLSHAYTIVTPPGGKRDWSLITAESPMECITAHDPATGEILAGLKMFRDDWDTTDFAYLFLPGKVMVAKCEVGTSTLFVGRQIFFLSDRWEWDDSKEQDVPGDEVAMVRFRNKHGRSEIAGALDTLDRINDKLFHEYWVGKLQAFKQRALEVPDEDDEVDEADDDVATPDNEDWAQIFTSAPDALWKLPKGAKIWESTQADLNGMLASIKHELQWLAFTESKPLHLVTPDAANQSAEGASTQKEEHSYEIEDRRDRAEGSWARTLSLAFLFQGDAARSKVETIEPIWGPLERYSLQEKADAASKVKGIVPVEAIQTDFLQYSPGDVVDRLRPMRGTDLLFMPPSASGSPLPNSSTS